MNNTYIKGNISKGEFVSELFKQRVESIGGTYEANDCLVNTLNSLTDREFKDAKAILTPNGYLVDKLPTIKPNGGGDATIVRNVVKTRVNSSGLIESNAVNVLAPDYLNGVCPALNVEGQATNLLLHSEDISNAEWSKINNGTGLPPVITPNFATSPSGDNSADRLVLDRGVGTTSTDNSLIVQSYILGLDNNTNSVYLKSTNGDNVIVNFINANKRKNITVTGQWQRFEIFDNSPAQNFQLGLFGDINVKNVDLLFWGAQGEPGIEPTSYIPTTTAQVTRSADTVTVPIPTGTTEIIEKYEDGTTNTITTIPASPYTVPTGKRYKYILMR